MTEYDWQLSAGAPLCGLSDSFYRTVREAVFQQLTETTPEQFQAAREHIRRLRDELLGDIQPMHYGALIGTHRCVNSYSKRHAPDCAVWKLCSLRRGTRHHQHHLPSPEP